MKSAFLQRLTCNRYVAAVGAGLLLAAAFPTFNLAALAWIAPGLLLAAALGTRGGDAFRIGYVGGLAYHLASLHWLLFIPFPAGAVAGWLALSAYVALYPAAWIWLCWTFFPRPPAADPNPGGVIVSAVPGWAGFRAQAGQVSAASWSQRVAWGLFCAVLWVALEMWVGWFLTGFPWNFLGVSQYQMLPLIQIASLTGVYGVSFLVVWFSVSWFCAVLVWVGRPAARSAWLGEILWPLLVLFGVAAYGFRQLTHEATPARELKVALVQPSIPQTLIWNPKENPKRFQQILQWSRSALATKPDLLIWPEAALPEFSEENYHSLTNLIAASRVWMVLGADDAERNPHPAAAGSYLYYNAAFLLDPAGRLAGTYHKQRLVIFGEYVPFLRALPFLKYLTPIEGGFTPGERPVQFRLTQPRAQCSVLICFEDTFPAVARRAVGEGTDFLVNLTNDGWFGKSAEQWQHAVNAVFRAVENGVPLVRCTNNGLTCWVDARGRMRGVDFGDGRDVYAAGFKAARIPLPAEGRHYAPTFYRRHGDWFGWGCVACAALMGLARCGARVRRG